MKDQMLKDIIFIFALVVIFIGLIAAVSGCSSAPTPQFNSEDQQDGSCYATMGGLRGYCNSVDDKTIDVFCNNCYYNEAK